MNGNTRNEVLRDLIREANRILWKTIFSQPNGLGRLNLELQQYAEEDREAIEE